MASTAAAMAPTDNLTQPPSVTWHGLVLVTNVSTARYDDEPATAAPRAGDLNLAYFGLTAIVLLALVTNTTILIVARRQRKLHTVFFHLLTSLAVVHLVSALTIMPFGIAKASMGTFPLGGVYCQLWQLSLQVLVASTLIHMFQAALHAQLMLSFPSQYRQSPEKNKTRIQVTVAWVLPAFLAIPGLVMTLATANPTTDDCSPISGMQGLSSLIPLLFVPLLMTIIIYTITGYRMKQTGGMAVRMASQRGSNNTLYPGPDSQPRVIVKDEESHICNSETASLASGQEFEPYAIDPILSKPLETELEAALQNIEAQGDALGAAYDDAQAPCDGTDAESAKTEETASCSHDDSQDSLASDTGSECEPGSPDHLQTPSPDPGTPQVKPKRGKEQLNIPVCDGDINVHLDTTSLINGSVDTGGRDNQGYDDNSLASMIQVHPDKVKGTVEDEDSSSSPEPESPPPTGSDNCMAQDFSRSNSAEDGTGTGKEPRRTRSILRRDGSTRPSKKVKFDVQETVGHENKAPRIQRKPTGYRRDNRNKNSNMIQRNGNGDAGHNNNVANGGTGNGSVYGGSSVLWGEKNGRLCPVDMEVLQSTEYLERVHHQHGLRLSRKIRSHKVNLTLLTVMLVTLTMMAGPHLLLACVRALCPGCTPPLTSHVTMLLEWLLMAITTTALPLYATLSAQFQRALQQQFKVKVKAHHQESEGSSESPPSS